MIQFLSNNWIFAIGFLAQGIFAFRMAVQWLFAESKGKAESPVVFWQLSLLGSFVLLIYGGLRNDLVIILGQSLSYFIFIRNLALKKAWSPIPLVIRIAVIGFPVALVSYLVFNRSTFFSLSYSSDTFTFFFIVGTLGQLLMSLRFVHQWYVAEKTKTGDIPPTFWYITFLGSLFIIIYALERFDPVLLLAQSFSLLSSLRNIQLGKKDFVKQHVTTTTEN